jgi:hypothetical protein
LAQRSASKWGSGRSSAALTTLKTAVAAEIASDNIATAQTATPGDRRNDRAANAISRRRLSTL